MTNISVLNSQRKTNQPRLRNKAIAARDFSGRNNRAVGAFGLQSNSLNASSRLGKSSINLLSVSGTSANSSIRRINGSDEDEDTEIKALDASTVSDMMSVGGDSMAGISDASSIVQVVGGGNSDYDASMYDQSTSDVQIIKNNDNSVVDEINTSMAGMTDMSMSDV